MNSTPNYGYETQISAISAIDRDLKRVEGKADKAYEQVIKHEENLKCLSKQKGDSYSKCETDTLLGDKVDEKDGFGLIADADLQQIRQNQSDISALESRTLANEERIEKTYTQGEVDALLRGSITHPIKIDTVDLNDLITPGFYYRTGGTQAEVANKPSTSGGVSFSLMVEYTGRASDGVIQTFKTYSNSNIFTRAYQYDVGKDSSASGNWSPWRKIAFEE